MIAFFTEYLSPKRFFIVSGATLPYLWLAFAITFVYGLFGGLVTSPADYQQGDGFRVLYVHVPSAIMSMGLYAVMAGMAILTLVYKIKLADWLIKVIAPLGALLTLLTLVTGSLWGKPMWGTWWTWDARLTSELVLLFLYVGVMALRQALPATRRRATACAIVVLVGAIDLPIIHYSVEWWNTLHQGSSLTIFEKPKIHESMLYPLLSMLASFAFYCAAITIVSVRKEIICNEKGSQWLKEWSQHAN